ncbi:thioether cross-link-forming SCIFF peptide maturase [Anaerotruncus sp. DFI.9.16]|uniref:thioether cross-link-forming SCIFF peptide maturase n=1 Tax=Anaerotruncus sp. DFI.9.16 TaxID=2965275 RepID=UPI00210DA9CC|nr:thioether cross-link-forming SCIFF peptide maturase [Anaerotruncus sp. DFI.9.16]MCQ4894572.1 thioether cross-link-forming SCIFF peptide maturase [Anaerotruncus sp. DFI.9.16]
MIHQYRLNGYNIVLDVNSGAVHLMDDLSFDLLDMLGDPIPESCPGEVFDRFTPQYAREEVEDAFRELLALQKADQLCSSDDYDQFAKLMTPSPVKAVCLHIAHDCNLRCKYCFADTGEYMGHRELMSLEVGKAAIDYLIKHSCGRHNLEVDFFGGEPLMNFEVVKEIVRYARSLEQEHNKLFRFTITTNGLLLDDDKIDFINREMSNVVLSIDGRREVNDRVRVRVDGRGSYDSILPKFQKLVEKRRNGPYEQYYARGTFTKYNKDFAEDVLHLSDMGFDQVSVEPVVTDPAEPYALTGEDLPEVFAEYERLAKIMIERHGTPQDFNFFHFMLDLDQGPCAIKRLRGCGCGNEYVAITPSGDVYPCHQFVGHDGWKMGNVFDQSLDFDLKCKFAAATVYGKPECKNCWAKFYCSGGCNANSMQYSGDILKPYKLSCELEKKRLECAIMIKAATL